MVVLHGMRIWDGFICGSGPALARRTVEKEGDLFVCFKDESVFGGLRSMALVSNILMLLFGSWPPYAATCWLLF
jgi:hypothetical protein